MGSLFSSDFVESTICMEEFSLAYDQVSLFGRKQHLIVVLVEQPEPGVLPPELENYLARNTYIEAQNYVQALGVIREKIRCAMPNTPLNKLKVHPPQEI